MSWEQEKQLVTSTMTTSVNTESIGSMRQPGVIAELEHQEKALETLNEIVMRLAGRLSIVMGNGTPAIANQLNPEKAHDCTMVKMIADRTEAVAEVSMKLMDILDRLEI